MAGTFLNENAITIRGHHVLCILGFRGRGYDERFVRHMAEVVKAVKAGPDAVLAVTDRCDDICSACPHARDSRCGKTDEAGAAVNRTDERVLARLGLESGNRYRAGGVYELVAERFGPSGMGRLFCANCCWRELGFCKEGLEALRRGEFFESSAGPREFLKGNNDVQAIIHRGPGQGRS